MPGGRPRDLPERQVAKAVQRAGHGLQQGRTPSVNPVARRGETTLREVGTGLFEFTHGEPDPASRPIGYAIVDLDESC